jgi:hypothetical protein
MSKKIQELKKNIGEHLGLKSNGTKSYSKDSPRFTEVTTFYTYPEQTPNRAERRSSLCPISSIYSMIMMMILL